MVPPPAISVVIPTRNRSSLVRRALLSVSQQRRAAAEVIVVDDGSTDDTVTAIRQLGVDVRIVEGGGLGAASARNTGVASARSEWVAFLDSDDVWHEDHLEAMAESIRASAGQASLYFSDAQLPGGTTAFARSGFAPTVLLEAAGSVDRWALRTMQPMMTPAVVVSRAAYLECGGMDPMLPCREDTHLFLLLGLTGRTCAVPGCTVTVTDDACGERLTAQLPGNDAVYWIATARLYEDVQRRLPALEPSIARELARRTATAHWRLGRLAWRRGRRTEAASSAWRSARVDPSVILGRIGRRA